VRLAILVLVLPLALAACGGGGEPKRLQLDNLVLRPADLGQRFARFDVGRQRRLDAHPGPRRDPERFDRVSGWKARFRRVGSTSATAGPLLVESRIDAFAGNDGAKDDLDAYEEEWNQLVVASGATDADRRTVRSLGDDARALNLLQGTVANGQRLIVVAWRRGRLTGGRRVEALHHEPVAAPAQQGHWHGQQSPRRHLVSNTGNAAGPWSKIAESTKLANSGSALKQSVGGKGYGPGVQAWYNQFLTVDPTDPNHVFAGLEEVYETKNGGSSSSTVGPYWNVYFSCWRPDVLYQPNGSSGCPLTTHSDQHAVAVGTYKGKQWLYVGNDGGIYKRPLNGSTNADGHATDWESLNDGSIDALQYYAVGVGLAKSGVPQNPSGAGAIVSGGSRTTAARSSGSAAPR
jgi:hypothetical protein